MKLSKKSLFLPILALGLISGPAFAGKAESQVNPLAQVTIIQPQAPAQPIAVPFDGAPEALHAASAVIFSCFAFKSANDNELLIPKVILAASFGYLFSKWFDKNIMGN